MTLMGHLFLWQSRKRERNSVTDDIIEPLDKPALTPTYCVILLGQVINVLLFQLILKWVFYYLQPELS